MSALIRAHLINLINDTSLILKEKTFHISVEEAINRAMLTTMEKYKNYEEEHRNLKVSFLCFHTALELMRERALLDFLECNKKAVELLKALKLWIKRDDKTFEVIMKRSFNLRMAAGFQVYPPNTPMRGNYTNASYVEYNQLSIMKLILKWAVAEDRIVFVPRVMRHVILDFSEKLRVTAIGHTVYRKTGKFAILRGAWK